jgi:hypothetical protein
MEYPSDIVQKAENEVTQLLLKLPVNMVYHNLNHTREVVNAAEKIGQYANLSEEEMEILMLAAWFHDAGFRYNYDLHEEKSAELAEKFLKEHNYPSDKTEKVISSIMSTKIDQTPISLIEKVLNDADFIHLSKKSYFDRLLLLKSELERIKNQKIEDAEWYEQNLQFLRTHRYHTEYGKTVLGPKVEKNVLVQTKMIKKLVKLQDQMIGKDLNLDPERVKELRKKLKKVEGRPDRGIETMFRLTSRNHISLSSIADNKANILISVNSIIISIIISGLIKTLDNHPHLIWPTYMILTINVITIVFAIIALRPNVSKGKFTRADIEQKNTNLLFFGNFHSMDRADYKWGMMEMLSDSNYLYSSLIDDIYFLGRVLGKKYKYLRYSYNIFMYGIILAVIAYVIANFNYLNNAPI